MFRIRFDAPKGSVFPEPQRVARLAACRQVAYFASLSMNLREEPLYEWFGAAKNAILIDNLKRMYRVIWDEERTVTLVDARTFDLQVSYNPEDIFEPPTLNDPTQPWAQMTNVLGQILSRGDQPPSATKTPMTSATVLGGPSPPPGPNAGGFFGYAYPIDNRSANTITRTHQGSGMRIYLGKIYFGLGPNSLERAQTIYHEMTHKVLGTNDLFYGAADCRATAGNNDPRAIRNADNYGYYVTSLAGHKW